MALATGRSAGRWWERAVGPASGHGRTPAQSRRGSNRRAGQGSWPVELEVAGVPRPREHQTSSRGGGSHDRRVGNQRAAGSPEVKAELAAVGAVLMPFDREHVPALTLGNQPGICPNPVGVAAALRPVMQPRWGSERVPPPLPLPRAGGAGLMRRMNRADDQRLPEMARHREAAKSEAAGLLIPQSQRDCIT